MLGKKRKLKRNSLPEAETIVTIANVPFGALGLSVSLSARELMGGDRGPHAQIRTRAHPRASGSHREEREPTPSYGGSFSRHDGRM